MIVDWAVYENGKRLPDDIALADALETGRRSGGFTWIGLFEPTLEEFDEVAQAFDLHPLAVEDAIHAHQRPKLERYGDTLFVVLKPARYVDSEEVIEVGEIMLFVGVDFVVAVRHGPSAPLAHVRRSLEEEPDRLIAGPAAVLHAVADRIVDEYATVLRELDRDIDEIEDQVFSGPRASHSERIFKLKREVVEFRRAVDPLARPLQQLPFELKRFHEDLPEYFRDVHDHVLRVSEHLGVLDSLLDSALNATVAQVGMRQNEDMRKISGWVAIVAVPTMIAGIYGMNFEYMPELEWRFGYPLVLALMAASSFVLYRNFKRRNWL